MYNLDQLAIKIILKKIENRSQLFTIINNVVNCWLVVGQWFRLEELYTAAAEFI